MDLYVAKIIADYAKWPHLYNFEDALILRITRGIANEDEDGEDDDNLSDHIVYVGGNFYVISFMSFKNKFDGDGKVISKIFKTWSSCEVVDANPDKYLLLMNSDHIFSCSEIIKIQPRKKIDKICNEIKLQREWDKLRALSVSILDRPEDIFDAINLIYWSFYSEEEQEFPTTATIKKAQESFLDLCLNNI